MVGSGAWAGLGGYGAAPQLGGGGSGCGSVHRAVGHPIPLPPRPLCCPLPGTVPADPPSYPRSGRGPHHSPSPRGSLCALSRHRGGGIQRGAVSPACFPQPNSIRAPIWDVKLYTVCSLHFLLPRYFDGKPRRTYPTFTLCYRGFWAAHTSRRQRRRLLRAGRSGLRSTRYFQHSLLRLSVSCFPQRSQRAAPLLPAARGSALCWGRVRHKSFLGWSGGRADSRGGADAGTPSVLFARPPSSCVHT